VNGLGRPSLTPSPYSIQRSPESGGHRSHAVRVQFTLLIRTCQQQRQVLLHGAARALIGSDGTHTQVKGQEVGVLAVTA